MAPTWDLCSSAGTTLAAAADALDINICICVNVGWADNPIVSFDSASNFSAPYSKPYRGYIHH